MKGCGPHSQTLVARPSSVRVVHQKRALQSRGRTRNPLDTRGLSQCSAETFRCGQLRNRGQCYEPIVVHSWVLRRSFRMNVTDASLQPIQAAAWSCGNRKQKARGTTVAPRIPRAEFQGSCGSQHGAVRRFESKLGELVLVVTAGIQHSRSLSAL